MQQFFQQVADHLNVLQERTVSGSSSGARSPSPALSTSSRSPPVLDVDIPSPIKLRYDTNDIRIPYRSGSPSEADDEPARRAPEHGRPRDGICRAEHARAREGVHPRARRDGGHPRRRPRARRRRSAHAHGPRAQRRSHIPDRQGRDVRRDGADAREPRAPILCGRRREAALARRRPARAPLFRADAGVRREYEASRALQRIAEGSDGARARGGGLHARARHAGDGEDDARRGAHPRARRPREERAAHVVHALRGGHDPACVDGRARWCRVRVRCAEAGKPGQGAP